MRLFLFGLLLLVAGCSAPIPTPAPSSPVPPLVAASPTPSPAPNDEVLRLFPLNLGAHWVYRAEKYDTLPNDLLPDLPSRQITATVMLTDTVMDVRQIGEYYAAQVVREQSIIATSIDLNLLGAEAEFYFADHEPYAKWLVLTEDSIYSLPEISEPFPLASARLEYKFPLTINARWYPEPDQRAQMAPDDPRDIPGYRVVLPLPSDIVRAGMTGRCFEIRERYNPGDNIEYFCEGIGVVGEHFDHAGTPFGSHSHLERFLPGK